MGLKHIDPCQPGRAVGKFKRVRGVLSWALGNDAAAGERLAGRLVATVQGHGGFRTDSGNYCGAEAVANLTSAFASLGWDLGSDGSLQPKVLDSLSGRELTAALHVYADRARRGALDNPLLAGTAKDLLEATAAHAISQRWGSHPATHHFPTLLGQAFTAVGLATANDPMLPKEPVHRRVERAAYDLGCALNALRNKEGTGHGRPWVSSVTPAQGRFAIESMGNIASLILDHV